MVKIIFRYALIPDFAIVKAWKGDNRRKPYLQIYCRNFNPMMAMVGKITIAEVEEPETGELDPDQIHTPGIYVHRIFQGEKLRKRIEKENCKTQKLITMVLSKNKLRCASQKEIKITPT